MKLLSEINEAAETLIKTTAKVEQFMEATGLGIEPINEAVQTFLSKFATQIEKGEFKPAGGKPDDKWLKTRENVIDIFTAIDALSDKATAMAYQPDRKSAGVGTEIDQNAIPIGSVLQNFYGKNGPEAHKIAKARLIEIGLEVSPSLRQQAEKAVDDPTRIREYSNRLQVSIEPVMNELLSRESNEATMRLKKKKEQERQDNMGRPMQGVVPQRSGA